MLEHSFAHQDQPVNKVWQTDSGEMGMGDNGGELSLLPQECWQVARHAAARGTTREIWRRIGSADSLERYVRNGRFINVGGCLVLDVGTVEKLEPDPFASHATVVPFRPAALSAAQTAVIANPDFSYLPPAPPQIQKKVSDDSKSEWVHHGDPPIVVERLE